MGQRFQYGIVNHARSHMFQSQENITDHGQNYRHLTSVQSVDRNTDGWYESQDVFVDTTHTSSQNFVHSFAEVFRENEIERLLSFFGFSSFLLWICDLIQALFQLWLIFP